jgi:hypothetical protein
VKPGIFVGAEVHLSAYQGVFPEREAGRGIFCGAEPFLALPDHVIFKAVWSSQATGNRPYGMPGTLDLVNFERHQVRAQLVKSF